MRKPHSSIILYAASLIIFVGVGAAYFSRNSGGSLLGDINKVLSGNSVQFEVSEEKLEGDYEAGPGQSVLLARFKLKSDKDVVITNIQMNLLDNANMADDISHLYIKYPSSKYSAEQSGYSKIKWSSSAPRFDNLNLEIPANSDDVRIDVYGKLATPDSGDKLQAIFQSFGYLDATSSVIKITDVNFTSEMVRTVK